MPDEVEPNFPKGTPDECELLLRWLRYLRGAVIRKVEGLSEADARAKAMVAALRRFARREDAAEVGAWDAVKGAPRAPEFGTGLQILGKKP